MWKSVSFFRKSYTDIYSNLCSGGTIMEQFLTVKEICSMLNLNRGTVFSKIQKGELQAYKVGKLYRIKMTDFQDYLNKTKISA